MASVLANRLSIVDFARWIMSNSWNMQLDSAPSAVSLASEIHALLAERDNYLSESDFLQELRHLYDNVSVSVDVANKESAMELSPTADNEIKTVSIQSPQIVYVFRPISSPALSSVAVPVEA